MAPVQFNPTSISVNAPVKQFSHFTNGSLVNNPLGTGNLGPDVMSRIFMSFRSGIDSEVKWALQTICQLSMSSSSLVDFEKLPILGNELIKYFVKPFLSNKANSNNKGLEKTQELRQELDFSLDALLTIRNAAQDLNNQQWLSSVQNLKKNLVQVLRVLSSWVIQGTQTEVSLSHHNSYREGFVYLLDLIEVLSCYYINNSKNDPLYHLLCEILANSKDKHVIVGCIRSLSHLLIVKEPKISSDSVKSNSEGLHEDNVPSTNCIDSTPFPLIQQIVSYLLIGDLELTGASVDFIKEYLSSEAIHPNFPNSVKKSQLYRLKELCEDNTIFSILISKLPHLILSGIQLNDASKIPTKAIETFTRRSLYSSVPSSVPILSEQLYEIIVKFPEPLRASTWLRCCYEPVEHISNTNEDQGNLNIQTSGEVTQISLWKAYEKQFEKVWQIKEGEVVHNQVQYHKLLPAVDFIKNVSAAFPHSQAMVVNVPSEEPGQAPKRKFIIKGIQPRQFVVGIDVGNYEALRHQLKDQSNSTVNPSMPIGHIDTQKYEASLNANTNLFISSLQTLNAIRLPTTNTVSLEIIEYIMEELLSEDQNLASKFRIQIEWMKDVIYANPGLIDGGILSIKWLEYLV